MQRMFSDNLTLADSLVTTPENDLEAELLKSLQRKDEIRQMFVVDYKAALRKIDELKITGEYEHFVAEVRLKRSEAEQRAREKFEADNPHLCGLSSLAGIDAPSEVDEQLDNLFAGLRSPDPAQAQRFKAFYDGHGVAFQTYPQIKFILSVLERAKRRQGRVRLPTPWTNELEHMDAMRLLVAEGMSVSEAARERAIQEGKAGADERSRTLAKLYRQRVRLRE